MFCTNLTFNEDAREKYCKIAKKLLEAEASIFLRDCNNNCALSLIIAAHHESKDIPSIKELYTLIRLKKMNTTSDKETKTYSVKHADRLKGTIVIYIYYGNNYFLNNSCSRYQYSSEPRTLF